MTEEEFHQHADAEFAKTAEAREQAERDWLASRRYTPLYDADFSLWCQTMARLLRKHALPPDSDTG